MQYKYLNDSKGNLDFGIILKIDANSNQSFVPNDPANRDWQEYQKWLSEGNEAISAE